MSVESYRFFGIDQFWARAMALRDQTRTQESEQLNDGLADYRSAELRQAIVHTRQDVVLLTSLLVDANKQLRIISRVIVVVAVLLLILLLK